MCASMADYAVKLFWSLIWQLYAASQSSLVVLKRYTTQGQRDTT